MDTIDPLPGVTVREGGRCVQGLARNAQPFISPCSKVLRPLNSLTKTGDVDEGQEEEGSGERRENYSVESSVPKMSRQHAGPVPTRVIS